MSKVVVHRHAAKYHKRLSTETKDRIKKILKELEARPLTHPSVKKCMVNGQVITGCA